MAKRGNALGPRGGGRWYDGNVTRTPAILTAIACVSLASCGGSGGGGDGGAGSPAGGGPNGGGSPAGGAGAAHPDACAGSTNQPGLLVDLAWPAASNVGHDAIEGNSVHFHWTGSHNVLQVATFDGQVPPTPTLGDAKWPGEITTGKQRNGGVFAWTVGDYECGYRPGIYFFVDEDNPQGGIVSVSYTVDGTHFGPRPCTALAGDYQGRHASFADRKGCTTYEVNNFQTEAHFDWVQPIFTAKQGDIVVYRWTGEHNVVQVHDVTQDALVPGGVHSGAKTNCVGGPHYECVDGSGEFAFDTTDYHPGLLHISDECAMTCTGHTTGMEQWRSISAIRSRKRHPAAAAEGGDVLRDRQIQGAALPGRRDHQCQRRRAVRLQRASRPR